MPRPPATVMVAELLTITVPLILSDDAPPLKNPAEMAPGDAPLPVWVLPILIAPAALTATTALAVVAIAVAWLLASMPELPEMIESLPEMVTVISPGP